MSEPVFRPRRFGLSLGSSALCGFSFWYLASQGLGHVPRFLYLLQHRLKGDAHTPGELERLLLVGSEGSAEIRGIPMSAHHLLPDASRTRHGGLPFPLPAFKGAVLALRNSPSLDMDVTLGGGGVVLIPSQSGKERLLILFSLSFFLPFFLGYSLRMIPLPQPPECWNYTCAPLCLAFFTFR